MRGMVLVLVLVCLSPLAAAKRHAGGHPKRVHASATKASASAPHRAGGTMPHRIGGMTYVSATPLAATDSPAPAAHGRHAHRH
jgi:hypothetical protein